MPINIFTKMEHVTLSPKSEARATAIRKAVDDVEQAKEALRKRLEFSHDRIEFLALIDDYGEALVKEREARSYL